MTYEEAVAIVEEYGYEAVTGECFEADIIENVVYLPKSMKSEQPFWDDAFYADFVRRAPDLANVSLELMTLFHEIGHLETWYLVEEEDETFVRGFCNLLGETLECAKIYFNIESEFIATEWAIAEIRKRYC